MRQLDARALMQPPRSARLISQNLVQRLLLRGRGNVASPAAAARVRRLGHPTRKRVGPVHAPAKPRPCPGSPGCGPAVRSSQRKGRTG
jgi:hypothetical protein